MDIPVFGTFIIGLALVSAGYTTAVAVRAGRGQVQLLNSARWGLYATAALVVCAIAVLAYAFQTHDFRIRYVAHYSDRSMPWWYLVTSLWGGQDGSLLWWAFLLCGWSVAAVKFYRRETEALQPWVIATLMSILAFFLVLMLFAANPFATTFLEAPPDGNGLQPLLQNYWMVIHPPSLYMGFIGWSVPFAYGIAALITGKLDESWLFAVRRWVLASWMFLSIGLMLGALWSYEELGWGGYWAWDPVENASFMPWLVGTAFLHSVMVQERYSMLRVWNIFLLCLTFFMTIFGTFLTRSGLIASVHSFAKSDIGNYFVGYLVVLVVVCTALIVWRLPKLKSTHRIESLVSREFAFLFNNWILLALMGFVLVLTTYPMVSDWLRGSEVTVGPAVYNRWLIPFGVVLLLLSGIGPLLSWRRSTGKQLWRAFLWPTLTTIGVGVGQVLFGEALGFPAFIDSTPIYRTPTGDMLAAIHSAAPILTFSSAAFAIASIVQEYWRGTRARMRTQGEGVWKAVSQLTVRARRRYGGYIVHLAIAAMFIGFAGAAYDTETEGALRQGESLQIRDYSVRFEGRRFENDHHKKMLFVDVRLTEADSGETITTLSPAKFIYRTHPESPTTEVAIRTTLKEDVYVILNSVDFNTGTATIRVVVRPLVMWIWIGGLLLILGTVIAAFPTVAELTQSQRSLAKAAAALLLCASVLIPVGHAEAQQDSSSLHAGTVVMQNDVERALFGRLLCMCGDCSRLTLANCGCGWAVNRRTDVREQLARGMTAEEVEAAYRKEFGAAGLSMPSDEGLDRAIWVLPVVLTVFAAAGITILAMRWRKSRTVVEDPKTEPDEYDERVDEAMRQLEEEES